MSKRLGANITCPSCGNVYPTELFRSIWADQAENRELILSNKINAVTCPRCKHHERLKFPFLCTNVKLKIAIWYEPYPDPQIDQDIAEYRNHFGPDSFYARAPRISDWEVFKIKLLEMEAASQYTVGNEAEISSDLQSNLRAFVKQIAKEADKGTKKSWWWPF